MSEVKTSHTLKNLCADLREALRQLQKINHIHQAQLVQESHSELISGEPHCAEICVLHCQSKSFLQGCHANSHSTRCAKSHLLNRRASCPAIFFFFNSEWISHANIFFLSISDLELLKRGSQPSWYFHFFPSANRAVAMDSALQSHSFSSVQKTGLLILAPVLNHFERIKWRSNLSSLSEA